MNTQADTPYDDKILRILTENLLPPVSKDAGFQKGQKWMNTVEQQTSVTDLSCGTVTRGQMRDNTLQCTFGKDGKQYQGILTIHGKTATLYKSAIMEPMPVTTVH